MTEYQNRTVLRFGGSDARKFLQDLITNDIALADAGLCYAALLNPQGKYLFDFFVSASEGGYLIDIEASVAASFAQRMNMYKLRADVTIEATDLKVSRGIGPMPEGGFADPRSQNLGWRAYNGAQGEDVDWTALRVENMIPETGAELIVNDSYILEMGFERLNGVDFRKGCYVGQEVTARMKHKTDLRKGLGSVGLAGEVPYGTEISRDGKVVGKVLTQSGDKALAYLRFDRIGEGMMAGKIAVSEIQRDR